jgi:hypothetical protein
MSHAEMTQQNSGVTVPKMVLNLFYTFTVPKLYCISCNLSASTVIFIKFYKVSKQTHVPYVILFQCELNICLMSNTS